ncbi:hypothetical protein [Aggregatilinea lenta]|uniref:hypothetical protein n=1 Tax=Aggregatilinea lenta TaxID=913108 RepID=UPI000E5A4D9E|nr:hypothetical protein [Aggregatilinea lenta]
MTGSGSGNPIIWVVDENTRELGTSVLALQQAIKVTAEVDVKPLEALPHKEDYLDYIIDSKTAMLVVDQRLQEAKAGIDHTGIELARFIRSYDLNLPISLLTNYADEQDEFEGNEEFVDYVLSKADLKDTRKKEIIVKRILRHITVYQRITDERQKRHDELLQKSLRSELSDDEREELDKLGYLRSAAIAARDQIRRQELEPQLNELEKLLKDLQQSLVQGNGKDTDHE